MVVLVWEFRVASLKVSDSIIYGINFGGLVYLLQKALFISDRISDY